MRNEKIFPCLYRLTKIRCRLYTVFNCPFNWKRRMSALRISKRMKRRRKRFQFVPNLRFFLPTRQFQILCLITFSRSLYNILFFFLQNWLLENKFCAKNNLKNWCLFAPSSLKWILFTQDLEKIHSCPKQVACNLGQLDTFIPFFNNLELIISTFDSILLKNTEFRRTTSNLEFFLRTRISPCIRNLTKS